MDEEVCGFTFTLLTQGRTLSLLLLLLLRTYRETQPTTRNLSHNKTMHICQTILCIFFFCRIRYWFLQGFINNHTSGTYFIFFLIILWYPSFSSIINTGCTFKREALHTFWPKLQAEESKKLNIFSLNEKHDNRLKIYNRIQILYRYE